MAANLIPLAQPIEINDIETAVQDAIDARERLPALIMSLNAQRRDQLNAFLSAVAADFAAVKGDPDKAFVDAEFAKFNAWKASDDDLSKRIDAMRCIADALVNRVEEYKTTYRMEVAQLLVRQIEALSEVLQNQEKQENFLSERLRSLKEELGKLKAEYDAELDSPKDEPGKLRPERAAAKTAAAKKGDN